MGASCRLDHPAFLDAVTRVADRARGTYLAAVGTRLAGVLVAAVASAVPRSSGAGPAAAWAVLLGVAVAVGAEGVLRVRRPGRVADEAHAAAASTRALTWRYAVAGDPFAPAVPDVDAAFRAQLAAVPQHVTVVALPAPASAPQITASMRELRAAELRQRRIAYAVGRVEERRAEHAARAREAARFGTAHLVAAVVLGLVGLAALTARLAGAGGVGLVGAVACAVAGVAAWTQARQWGARARAWTVAGTELAPVGLRAVDVTEEAWPRFVDDAERAIGRERELWATSRGVAGPPAPDVLAPGRAAHRP